MRLPCARGSDPIVDALRDTFGAHPVRVPEPRVRAMTVLAGEGGAHVQFRGALDPLIAGDYTTPAHVITTSDVSSAFGGRTRAIEATVGLKLLDGLVGGFGFGPAMPSIEAAATTATSVWFAFEAVEREWIDINLVSRLLGKRSVLRNAATEMFFRADQPAAMLLVDSALRSASFVVGFGSESAASAKVDIGAIADVIGKLELGIDVKQRSDVALAFHGSAPLTFAFTCKEVELDPSGTIRSFDENRQSRYLASDDAPAPPVEHRYVAALQPGVPAGADEMVEVSAG
jgi:hypothetical protein